MHFHHNFVYFSCSTIERASMTPTQLDYAARSKDGNAVKQCYDNIAATLGEILAKL